MFSYLSFRAGVAAVVTSSHFSVTGTRRKFNEIDFLTTLDNRRLTTSSKATVTERRNGTSLAADVVVVDVDASPAVAAILLLLLICFQMSCSTSFLSRVDFDVDFDGGFLFSGRWVLLPLPRVAQDSRNEEK